MNMLLFIPMQLQLKSNYGFFVNLHPKVTRISRIRYISRNDNILLPKKSKGNQYGVLYLFDGF